ncbi:MAG: hypothetical protein MUC65_06155 [Pontiellaceae bacterium]|jgi:hypothetical protein|nr:hypothetical protein [Pontiellaceae bacterium]
MKRRQSCKSRVQIPFPVMLANFLVSVAVFGLSYVWLCARCDLLGNEIKRLEAVQRETGRLLDNEQDRWSSQLAPASLERALKRHHLAMRLPDKKQIVRVHSGVLGSVSALAYK